MVDEVQTGCAQCIALSAMMAIAAAADTTDPVTRTTMMLRVVDALARISRGNVPCPQHPVSTAQEYRCLLCLPQTEHASWPQFETHQNEHHRGPLDQLMVVNETGYPIHVTAALMGNALQVVAKAKPLSKSAYDAEALHAWTPDEPMPSGRAAWLCVTCGTRLTPETGVQPPAKGCLRKGGPTL